MWTERLGVAVDNQAVAGSTVAEQVEQIRLYQGDATQALWFSCTNDLLRGTTVPSYTAAISEGVALLRSRGLTVRLGTCPGLKDRAGVPENWKALQAGYTEGIRGVAGAYGLFMAPVASLYDPATMEATFLPNHPSDEGHAAIARAFVGWRSWLPLVRARRG